MNFDSLLKQALVRACSRETSADPNGWTPQNPFWAHCAVVALVVQDYLGGTLLRASLDGTPFVRMGSHYWNLLSHGLEVDHSGEQFGSTRPSLLPESRDRSYVLSFPETRMRYERFRQAVSEQLAHMLHTTKDSREAPSPRTPVPTRQFLVYLSGPITGLSWGKASSWYELAEARFPPHVVGVRPLRGKEYLQSETSLMSNYGHVHPLSSPKGIMTRDHFDATRADALLVNVLAAPERVSLGTSMEVAWAYDRHIPVVAVMTPENIHFAHPMFNEACSFICASVEEAADLVVRIVSPT